jgi:dolichol-phosphate mannosyltransferase
MSVLGFTIALLSFILGVWYLLQKISGINLTPGLTTAVLLISFFAGVQLLGLGLLGEYVGRIYDEVKKRPKYILDKKINFDD